MYRVLDVGKAGVPTLRNEQVYWLLTITRTPYWRQRLGSLWFSCGDRAIIAFIREGSAAAIEDSACNDSFKAPAFQTSMAKWNA